MTYCWRTYYHATGLRLLFRILYVPGPSTTAYARHNLQHFGVRQQYVMIRQSPPRMEIALLFPAESSMSLALTTTHENI